LKSLVKINVFGGVKDIRRIGGGGKWAVFLGV